MGLEALCRARLGRKTGEGKAHLEQNELTFQGPFSLRIPLGEVRSTIAARGVLKVTFSLGTACFELGRAAEAWALKIRYPRSLMDKLGVKAGSVVSVLGLKEEAFFKDLLERTENVTTGKASPGSDIVLVRMASKRDLARLPSLRKAVFPDGFIWAVWAKGGKDLREDEVRGAALASGLVDVKVASVSETLSGLKLVVPKAQRGRKS